MCVSVLERGRNNTRAGEGGKKNKITKYLHKELKRQDIYEGVKALHRYRSCGNYKCY